MIILKACLNLLIIIFLIAGNSIAQDSVNTKHTSDSLDFFTTDTLGLKLSYPLDKKLPKDILIIPKPKSPLEIDTRTGSFYTPKNVQDKMDDIMNRPRRDSFVPLLGLAAFAVSVAAKQMEAAKLFEPDADDYLLPQNELEVLEELWKKAPQKIDSLYLSTPLQANNTAAELQKTIGRLSEKNLIKTRTDGNKVVLFFPGQKLEYVKSLVHNAASDTKRSEEQVLKFLALRDRLQKIEQSAAKRKPNAE